MSSEERCPCTCGHKARSHGSNWNGESPEKEATGFPVCHYPGCGCLHYMPVKGHSPAPVDAEPKQCQLQSDDGALQLPKAPAPAEGAEPHAANTWRHWNELCKTAQEQARVALEQLAQAQFEVEALKGSVKDWRKAYEDAQRELAEARAKIRRLETSPDYNLPHNV